MARSQKKFAFGLLLVSFVLISIFLYANLDSGTRSDEAVHKSMQISQLKKQVESMAEQLRQNEKAMGDMRKEINADDVAKKSKLIVKENEVYDEKAEADAAMEKNVDQLEGDADHKAVEEEQNGGEVADGSEQKGVGAQPVHGNKVAAVHNMLKATSRIPVATENVCLLRSNYTHADSDVQMLDVYDVLTFENPDGGVWKQGWEITYDAKKVSTGTPLEVVVIPHSHCDPGWIKTFEGYYRDQTSKILSGMAKHLGEKDDMRFIYAEMSFLEMWWRDQTEATREKVKGYLKSGQFEIVTGGWVMTDEANAHYYSIITELLEGHEWIRNHIGGDFRPQSHWSIDPFGLSPSLPHLLSAANITNAALQRIHYSVKKHLAKNKQLEFIWRQMWGNHGGDADVRAHVFPFYSYDVPHTCGPEPRVCCQFDFNRLPGSGDTCPWNVPPQRINDGNVAERAFMIYDQYRKKSQLYGSNVLLVPLGDDFRYATDSEWDAQHDNYKKLFEFMNNKKEWNVHASFGTLADYFKLLDKDMKETNTKLPVLTGDFFTYADRDDHYWSGYFTSRPFYKQMDRVLQHYLRSAEIAFTMASMNGAKMGDDLFADLVYARRALSLFQHHDGVTGTAKDPVVIDYGEKMLSALNKCEKVLSASLLSSLDAGVLASPTAPALLMHEQRSQQDALPQNRIFSIGQSLVVFNTLSRPRTEPICIMISSSDARVKAESEVVQQISPVFVLSNSKLEAVKDQYELCFSLVVAPFSAATLHIVRSDDKEKLTRCSVSSRVDKGVDGFEFRAIAGDIKLGNDFVEAVFDESTGFLKTITPNGHSAVDVNLHFIHYGARKHKQMNNGGGDDLSGAYLFLPDGVARRIDSGSSHDVVVIDGPLMKRVIVAGHADILQLHSYALAKGSHTVDIETEVDIRSKSNFELAMRFDTTVKSGDDLYTDLNGLQMIRRRRMLNKLPLQAHYYPMPASAYIEDSATRMSLLGAQALGVASLLEGQMEVMLDRRLNQDDGRGLFQGVLDNKRTLSRFRLLVEPLSGAVEDKGARVGYHSAVGHAASMELHYPWIKMQAQGELPLKATTGLKETLSCDTHVVTLRTMAGATAYGDSGLASARREAALILHRPLADCRSKLNMDNECSGKAAKFSPQSVLPSVVSAQSTTLTLLYDGTTIDSVSLEPQQVKTVKVLW